MSSSPPRKLNDVLLRCYAFCNCGLALAEDCELVFKASMPISKVPNARSFLACGLLFVQVADALEGKVAAVCLSVVQ